MGDRLFLNGGVGMTRLPYWENDLDFQVSDLFPYDLDWGPVSANKVHGDRMVRLAKGAMALGSEFLYLSGLSLGVGGTMMWDGDPGAAFGFSLGFTVMLGFSRPMEDVVLSVLDSGEERGESALEAGVTECLFWSPSMPREVRKIIMIATPLPLKDEASFVDSLIAAMERHGDSNGLIPYYAELFGFRRSSVSYETDDLLDISISSILQSFEMSETRQVVGPPPDLVMPPLFDLRISSG